MGFKPHPATAVATLALFVALGGTSYAVTGGTPFSGKQFSGSQLANRSVAGYKLEAHTVTAAEVNVSDFPPVPAAVFAGDATLASTAHYATTAGSAATAKTAATATTITGTISGSQVSGAVANATNATTAGNAASAATITGAISGSQVSGAVADATSVGGDRLTNIAASSSSANDVVVASNLAGLSLSMRCTGGYTYIDANTSVNNASYGMSVVSNGSPTIFAKAEGNFTSAAAVTTGANSPAQLSFSYEQPGGARVAAGTLTAFDNGGTCSVFGAAQSSAG
jgi:hypothetical protein